MPLTLTADQVRDMAILDEKAIAGPVDDILTEIQKDIVSKAIPSMHLKTYPSPSWGPTSWRSKSA